MFFFIFGFFGLFEYDNLPRAYRLVTLGGLELEGPSGQRYRVETFARSRVLGLRRFVYIREGKKHALPLEAYRPERAQGD